MPVEGTLALAPGAARRSWPRTRSTCAQLEEWMRSYRPEELFDDGRRARAPSSRRWRRRASAGWAPTRTPTAALLLRDLELPDFRDYAVDVPAPGATSSEATRVLGDFLRDVMQLNAGRANFRVFGPDETASNRLGAVFEVTDRAWMADDRARATTTSRPTAA